MYVSVCAYVWVFVVQLVLHKSFTLRIKPCMWESVLCFISVCMSKRVSARVYAYGWWASLTKTKQKHKRINESSMPVECACVRSYFCIGWARCVCLFVCISPFVSLCASVFYVWVIFRRNKRQRTLPYSIIQPYILAFSLAPWGSDKIIHTAINTLTHSPHKYHQISAIFRTHFLHRYVFHCVWTCDSSPSNFTRTRVCVCVHVCFKCFLFYFLCFIAISVSVWLFSRVCLHRN